MANEKYVTNWIHGGKYTKLYTMWVNMRRRCNNPTSQYYHRYGGRGIKVCDEWENSFPAFREWAMANGYKERLSIERENNDKGYYPGNCTFIKRALQARNRESTVFIDGKTIPELAKEQNLSYSAARYRLFTKPAEKRMKK